MTQYDRIRKELYELRARRTELKGKVDADAATILASCTTGYTFANNVHSSHGPELNRVERMIATREAKLKAR